MIEIHQDENIIARFAGIFHGRSAQKALAVRGARHDRFDHCVVRQQLGWICFVVRTDRQVQITFVGLSCSRIFEDRYLPLHGCIVDRLQAGIILFRLITGACTWSTGSIVLRVEVRTGRISQRT
jgi:hypothetical protein